MLPAQRVLYRPDQVTVLDPADSRTELRMEFAGPSRLELLPGGAHGWTLTDCGPLQRQAP